MVSSIQLRTSLILFYQKYAGIFVLSYLSSLLIYGPLYTTPLLTDHLFSNVWLADFPSFRTTALGRWFADFLNYSVGNVGNPALQVAIASAIQALNGIMFATLFGVRKSLHVLLAALFICLHPSVLDYYSFTRDDIGFVLGDAMAILGLIALANAKPRGLATIIASFIFLLTLATYQPKIALIALLLLFWCIHGAIYYVDDINTNNNTVIPQISSYFSRFIFPSLISFLAAVFLYLFSIHFALSHPEHGHTYTNTSHEILKQLCGAFPIVYGHFGRDVDYLPFLLTFLPAITILAGTIILLKQACQKSIALGAICGTLLAVSPLALQLSFIINDQTPVAGRTLTTHAYFLLFFIIAIWSSRAKVLGTAFVMIFSYFFSIVGSQEVNYAVMKTMFDLSKITRITSEIEHLAPLSGREEVPVVVIGYLTARPVPKLLYFKNNLYMPRTRYEFFNEFCQPGILNFFLGKQNLKLIRPTRDQVAGAVASQSGRNPWPAPGAVFLNDSVIVVLLQRYNTNTFVTEPKEEFDKSWPQMKKFCG
jgi:hypothetical protein